MDILNKINEAINKPSFEEFFLNKKNKRMINKEWQKHRSDVAREIGQDFLDDDRYYGGDDDIEMDAEDAYDDFAHADGYSAYYTASEYTIEKFKRKYDYQRGDERDEDKQYELAKFLGYEPSLQGKL